jgi:asparagine synthase (glutamine-hydrolysing)
MIAVTGERVAANIDYALSQRNNHGISEGVGLWTVGALFPELRGAAGWLARGREVLEKCGRELIYEDGSFSQHSMNYHRVMLQDYVWALRLGELLGEPFSEGLKARVAKAADFLHQVQDESGRVPCYGQNDGALILPLDNCDYQDFRPAAAAAHYLTRGTRCFEPGEWDESLLWLFGEDALAAPLDSPKRTDLRAESGGYYTLRAKESWAFTRCAEFLDRPGQADMLHVDLWWRGQNIATDAGTYSYNAPAPWNNSLSRTAYHNTVTVDGLDQMEQASKFLWLPWLAGKVKASRRSPSGFFSYLEGEHDGYRRLASAVTHRRGILRLGESSWLVVDRLTGSEQHEYRLHWLFPHFPFEWDGEGGLLALRTPAGLYYVQVASEEKSAVYSLEQADDDSPRGWRAPYYMSREPALSVDMTIESQSQLFWTLFSPEPCRAELKEGVLEVEATSWRSTVRLSKNEGREGSLVTEALVVGDCEDRLTLG